MQKTQRPQRQKVQKQQKKSIAIAKKAGPKKSVVRKVVKKAAVVSTPTRSFFGGSKGDQNKADGEKYYQEAKASGNYQESPKGFLYRFLSNNGQSFGGKKPGERSNVTVHYEGKSINGKIFDSSIARGEPISFNLGQVIPGWREAVMLMSPGDDLECILPENLAYGKQGAGGAIGPCETLIFRIQLQVDEEAQNIALGEEFYAKAKATGAYHEDAVGYLYKYTGAKNSGNQSVGGNRPTPHDTVEVDYEGRLINGTVFDSSYKRGESISFPLNRVIPGWTHVVSNHMSVGDKVEVILPSKLAYGAQSVGPHIKAGSTLIFDVELHKF